MLLVAVVCMFAALGFYTYAVFNGRRAGLSLRHLVAFGLGLTFDYYGTHLMNIMIARFGQPPGIHSLSGRYSLWGMAFHFCLALTAAVSNRLEVPWVNKVFHRVSLVIYTLWLIAFGTGAVFGMIAASR